MRKNRLCYGLTLFSGGGAFQLKLTMPVKSSPSIKSRFAGAAGRKNLLAAICIGTSMFAN